MKAFTILIMKKEPKPSNERYKIKHPSTNHIINRWTNDQRKPPQPIELIQNHQPNERLRPYTTLIFSSSTGTHYEKDRKRSRPHSLRAARVHVCVVWVARWPSAPSIPAAAAPRRAAPLSPPPHPRATLNPRKTAPTKWRLRQPSSKQSTCEMHQLRIVCLCFFF